jgi:hypothetical protein
MSKQLQIITIILAVLAVIAIGTVAYFKFSTEDTWLCQNGGWVKHGNPSLSMPTTGCGPISTNINQTPTDSQNIRNLNLNANDLIVSPFKIIGEARLWYFEGSFPIKLLDAQGNELATIQAKAQGDWMTENWVSFTASLRYYVPTDQNGTLILMNDNPSGLPENEQKIEIPVKLKGAESLGIKNLNITVNQQINLPFTLQGETKDWYFEGDFPVKVINETNEELISTYASATDVKWMDNSLAGKYTPFASKLEYLSQNPIKAYIVLEKARVADNEPLVQVTIPVIIPGSESMTLKVFLGNEIKNPGTMDCSLVYPVERIVAKTVTTAKASLEELLKGPTEAELKQKYYTSINTGVKLNKVTITKGTAYADFNSQLDYQVGGSCKVTAIASQIRETLKQFPTIKDVVISIDGRTEDILQP